ncbi:MAG: FAD-dependent 5-carboxymethylaminomethyl-2-thiouridine(34) oxidoreductase MnmC [Caldimonas sp.]
MNTAPILPARIHRDADGTPRSAEFGDIYHHREGALAQARHVFLGGNELPARWRGRDRFVILETGFGLGNNFLAAWAAWRADPTRCRQLHFISIEAAPPTRDALAALARDASLELLAAELAQSWPPLTWNMHRLAFAGGAIELLLAFGDVAAWLPQITAEVDAFFLDGFAPARNPAMWDARLFKAMARMAGPGATASTWTAAAAVRTGLRNAGFDVRNAAGVGAKRDITLARFAPRVAPRPSARVRAARPVPGDSNDERVLIVGGGLAGCAAAAALAGQGRSSLLLERRTDVAEEGSGNAGGLFHGVVHGADGRHARFHRAAALAARDAVRSAIERHGVSGSVGGLVRVEPRAASSAELQAVIDRLGFPADYVRAVSAGEASDLAGVAIGAPAWYYPQGGWVDPRALARSFLADAGACVQTRPGCEVAALCRVGEEWELLGRHGERIASARVVVLANAGGALDLLGHPPWPITMTRGQLTSLPAVSLPPGAIPRLPVAGAGYVLPVIDGTVWFGASSQPGDGDVQVRDADQAENLARLAGLIALRSRPSVADLGGRTAFRWLSDDRFPIIGAVPTTIVGTRAEGVADSATRLDQPRFISRAPGLFIFSALGSRGIAVATLGGRILASAITGAPSPVEADLLDAIDPARFASREFRRGVARAATSLALQPQPAPEGATAEGSAGV